jgi:hypothetical protein
MRNIWIGVALLFQLPISLYGSWLLYKHIHATELMWFIWWITVPMVIISSIISHFAEKEN